jgi:hypothetical protein
LRPSIKRREIKEHGMAAKERSRIKASFFWYIGLFRGAVKWKSCIFPKENLASNKAPVPNEDLAHPRRSCGVVLK